jgi:mRNA interferase YafQ
MLTAIFSTQFRRDYKLCQKRGCKMPRLSSVMLDLENEVPLQPKHRAHPLQGNYMGCTECHIEPDWLLIYKTDQENKEIYFTRTGTHADLFE